MGLPEFLGRRLKGLFTPLIELEPLKDDYWQTCIQCGKKILLGKFAKTPDGSWFVGEYYQIPNDCAQTPDGLHVVGGL